MCYASKCQGTGSSQGMRLDVSHTHTHTHIKKNGSSKNFSSEHSLLANGTRFLTLERSLYTLARS